ncbi:hypothetical protein A2697_00020 [Candidatus Curtissbacteria bacterium RIFCSPHIGHO2_01_FULL_41_44]|uniref:Prepilin-type N-terminal cleavage/methylation domain-containing protein n=1 Tax=Candidatus Curtissbacteria bacterium RIFCSPLOWO2_01_FULL_42_50 TaxID=1797730 RepID=A0A1F5H6T8_9BACT|nr:MAG: hypothetical protein A3C33_01865 [Candidatus Curtissbacteria bacterium RIFCSPHIGHO2_02_FULL_42_58]OGD94388.1 MAG: hypothetical protein A2697_00020 [Candidatus Curtissbacteria bacterium RIFCSPHIGHO2_01_FULL_41_44]OGD97662.1 MAG: hypothetical protein A3E71_00945 [Candidatus Curtissbacteria bacterium RIFCSPHIGHO2_12_FULL_42_33]OGD99893.1 MAG: hypothetical protein A3B54_00020 [Candidatus Curtissbacteria bacterium RIFCSPLOWO2_01_FULL_42_50]OGE02752.1 MAG: hypothetical protein A3G16_02985 [Ca
MDSKPILNLHGFTIIELITGLAIIGLVSILVASVYIAHFRLFSNQNTAIDVASQNKLALDEIVNQIRQSQSVVTTCADCAGDTTSATVLVLQLWPQDASDEPLDNGNYDYIVYKRDATDNTKLVRKIVADASSSRTSGPKIIATTISDLQFTYDNANPTQAGEVTTSVTTTATSQGKTQTTTQKAKAVLRNK